MIGRTIAELDGGGADDGDNQSSSEVWSMDSCCESSQNLTYFWRDSRCEPVFYKVDDSDFASDTREKQGLFVNM
jgi:hypothetical protein